MDLKGELYNSVSKKIIWVRSDDDHSLNYKVFCVLLLFLPNRGKRTDKIVSSSAFG